MLRIFGSGTTPCDGTTRREAMRVGGLSLFSGMTLPRLLAAKEQARSEHPAAAKAVILLNLFGGPPHQDLFDLKPAAPLNVRGEFQPIPTVIPGLQISELLPKLSRVMDRCSLIRTYSHRYNSHNPYNVFTGFDLGQDRDNYFAKLTDHPSISSVCQYLRPSQSEVPPYVILPAFPGYSQALRRSGPYGGYLGSQYDPLFTIWDKKFAAKGGFYKPTSALGVPLLPALDSLPEISANRLDRRRSLLQQLDDQVSQWESSRAVSGMSRNQQKVFSLLTSSRTRNAFDLTREPQSIRDAYGETVWGNSLLICRRLVEAGSTFVSVNWEEADSGNHWDMHSNNFGMCRVLAPTMDQIVSALVLDLESRGLLDSTLVLVMGEMGRTPRTNKSAGRDHWPQCGFVLMAGGGTKRGFVLGRTDELAAYPLDRPVSSGDLAATIYTLLGVDSEQTVPDLTGRPIHIAHGGDPVREIMA